MQFENELDYSLSIVWMHCQWSLFGSYLASNIQTTPLLSREKWQQLYAFLQQTKKQDLAIKHAGDFLEFKIETLLKWVGKKVEKYLSLSPVCFKLHVIKCNLSIPNNFSWKSSSKVHLEKNWLKMAYALCDSLGHGYLNRRPPDSLHHLALEKVVQLSIR